VAWRESISASLLSASSTAKTSSSRPRHMTSCSSSRTCLRRPPRFCRFFLRAWSTRIRRMD
jgi:hypothetical protein